MGEARKNEVKGVGYVVVYQEDYDVKPLRAFVSPGAAKEFRDMVNNYNKDDRERRIRGLAATYDPKKLYSYPESSPVGIAKLKQIPNGTF